MPTPLIVFGGGEHGRVIMDAISLQPDRWTLLGYLDPRKDADPRHVGDDADLPKLLRQHPQAKFISGLGGDAARRRRILSGFALEDARWATVIHPSAIVSPKSEVGPGCVILARSVVQPGTRIGHHAIINTGAIVEHDSVLGDFVHVAPGAVTGGSVQIGNECFIGLGSRIRDHLSIGCGVTVGVGAVVVTDIPDGETVVGSPARRLGATKANFDLHDICIPPECSIYEAMSVIGKHGTMAALVTSPDHNMLGMLTDGDIRRALLSRCDLNSPVGPIMNRKFRFVRGDVSRAAALDQMEAQSLRMMPVLDDAGRVVGLHLLSELIGTLNRPNIAVVMAGGRGVRLRPLTDQLPKPMVKVAGRPILEHIVLHLVGSGIRDIYLSVNYLAETIEAHFGDGTAFGCQIHYLREDKPLGTGGALRLLPDGIVHPLLVMNGDLITQFDVDRFLAHHRQGGYAMTIGVHDYRVDIPYGVVELNDVTRQVSAILEKPERHYLVNGGIYAVNPGLLDLIQSGEELSMPELIERSLGRGDKVGAHLVEGDWIDVGHHHQLAAARGLG
jgi:sugar O-acyltransferase (sialic acid O-acetyltransferase NeuD family)